MTDEAVSRALDQAARAAFLLGVNWQGGTEELGAARAVEQARGRVLPALSMHIDQAVADAALARRLSRHRTGRKVSA